MSEENVTEESGGLAAGSISTAEVTVMAVAGAAPVMCVGASFGAMMGLTGTGAALAAGIAALLCAVVGVCYGHLSRDYNCAGGSYAYVTNVFGVKAGLWSAFVYYGVVATCAAGPACIFASYLNGLTGAPMILGWVIFAAFVYIICWQGVALSTKATAIVFLIEMVLMIIPAVKVIGMNVGGFDMGTAISNAVAMDFGVPGMFAAICMWMYSFVGFEAASFMGEELKDGWKGVRLSVPLTALLTGVVYFISFALWTANISPDQVAAVAASADPLAEYCRLVGYAGGQTMVSIAVMVACLACGMALCPMFSRFMYDQGRTGLLPKSFTKVNKKSAPWFAQTVFIIISFVVSLYGLYGGLNDVLSVCGVMAMTTYATICFTAVKVRMKEKGAGALIMGKILPIVVGLIAIYSIFFTQATKYVIIAIIWYVVSLILANVFAKKVDKDVLAS